MIRVENDWCYSIINSIYIYIERERKRESVRCNLIEDALCIRELRDWE